MNGCKGCKFLVVVDWSAANPYGQCRHHSSIPSPEDAVAWWPTLTEKDREHGCGDFEASAENDEEKCIEIKRMWQAIQPFAKIAHAIPKEWMGGHELDVSDLDCHFPTIRQWRALRVFWEKPSEVESERKFVDRRYIGPLKDGDG